MDFQKQFRYNKFTGENNFVGYRYKKYFIEQFNDGRFRVFFDNNFTMCNDKIELEQLLNTY